MRSKRRAARFMHNDDQWKDRYSRQTRFTPIGQAGQDRLREAAILIVGCGALGASLAQHMVRAGVGTVRLADRDYVEPSNLQRQMLFDEEDALAALPKAVAASNKLRRINSDVNIEPHVVDVTARNAAKLTKGIMLVLDGTDNVQTRLALSDCCFQSGIPLLYGGIAGSQGMSATLIPGETACLRCLIGGAEEGEAGETCETIGVISPIVDWIAALQAAEALKWLTGSRDALRRTWLSADLWPFQLFESNLPKPSVSCSYCSRSAVSMLTIRKMAKRKQRWDSTRGSDTVINGSAAEGSREESRGAERSREADLPSEVAHPTDDSKAAAHLGESIERDSPIRTAMLCGRDTVQVSMGRTIDLSMAEQYMAAHGLLVTSNPYLVRVQVQEGERLVLFPDGRILVQGTQDTSLAAALCDRYVQGIEEAAITANRLNRAGGQERS
ncbi:ThiF family adenylyltransferase [Paenibacillus mendelii]|uniref:ThiF family adenylyltransferase n=1 Tax=Paenibacillus mendelii TaxID=206163 RepID=A0ABV6J8X2_9BACL|nr:ThiF family adenylyltransferase [Paenibacillus mendelii]MCQ6559682.1 ThiF family adenylyltransferase [Paenibacillus mendelii]